MDIPAPVESNEEQKIIVKSVTGAKPLVDEPRVAREASRPKDDTSESKTEQSPDIKDAAFTAEEEKRKNLAAMITEKRYFLPIKEKRQNAALTLVAMPKKAKKPKKATSKKSDSTTKKPGSSHQTILIIILVVVLIGTLFAIDAGMIDIGIKLPFDLIKNV